MIAPISCLLLVLLQSAPSQEHELPSSKGRDIIALRDERAELESRKTALALQSDEASHALLDRLARDQVEAQIKLLPTNDTRIPDLETKLQYYESLGPWNDTNKPDQLKANMREIKKAQFENEKGLRDNEREMYRATMIENDRQDFMNRVSWIFGGLIAMLVVGFFVVVFRNESVCRSVFEGPNGLQMLTLLSVVIAIVLFGITGTLEGKELAALLGGLSGYILGRVADHQRPTAEKKANDCTAA